MFLIGKTALHWAASVNSLDVTKELLRNGAKKDAQDEKVSWIHIYFSCELGSQEAEEFYLTAYLVKFTGHLQRKLIVKVDDTCGHFMWLLKSYAQGIVGFSPLAHRGLQGKLFNRSDEGLTLETSAFLPFTVANLRFQPSC